MHDRQGRGKLSPDTPEAFWQSAALEQIEERLQAPGFLLTVADAQAVRDRTATFFLTDPSRAFTLSRLLLNLIHRTSPAVDPATTAHVWRCHAEACLFTGRTALARRAYERASKAADRARATQLLGQILVGQVYVLSITGAAADASRLAARAERLLTRAGDLIYLGKLHMNRGNAFYQQDEYAAAFAAYTKAARVFERAGVRDATWVGLLMNQAIACTNLSRIEEARGLFLQTEEQCERLDLEWLGARAIYNRAFLEALRGDYREALTLLERADKTFVRQDVMDMSAATKRARAEIYLDLGMPAEACELARAAAEAFARQDMPIDAVLSQLHEGRGLLRSGRVAAAGEVLAAVGRFYQTRRMRPRLAATRLYQARAALERGELPAARRLARRSQRMFADLRMSRGWSEASRLLAELWLAAGRPRRADTTLAPALARVGKQVITERLELWALAGRIAQAQDRPRVAGRRLRRAVNCLEAQRLLIPGTELRARAFEDRVGIYHDLIDLTLRSVAPRFATIFRLVESARARGFRDRAQEASEPVRQRITAQRARLGSLIRRLEEMEYAASGAPDQAAVSNLQMQIRTLENEIAERVRRVGGRRKAAWQGVPDPAAIARLLRPDEVVIEYYVARGVIVALVLTRTRRVLRRLPQPPDVVRRIAERIRFQLDVMTLDPVRRQADPSFVRQAAEHPLGELHTALLAPLTDLLPPSGRLLLVPHGFLHTVPFECLWDGTDYIDARYTISRIPSADFLLRRAESRRPHRRWVYLSGTIKSGPAAVAAELKAVAACFARSHRRILRDPPTRAILAALPRCRILHLSAHGVFREDNPLFSRISTADGALFLSDLLGSRLAAELVVLSACNAGRAFTGRGDDLSGVAHGFLAGGAGALVAGMWRVHDRATRALMTAFYRHYTGDARRDPALALRRAGQDVRRKWDHPFYWGGFSVHGG